MPKITSYIILLLFPIFLWGQQHTVQQAEFFWGTSDPGQGNGTQLVATDGNFNEAVEQVFKNSISLPNTGGLHLFNIRVKDGSGSWGPIYKRTVYLGDNLRDMKITAAEYYWDNGTHVPLLVFDGNFNEAIESVFKNSITLPTTGGLHLFNIRVKDEANLWGPVYKRTVYLGDNQRDMKITAGEYYWDNGTHVPLLVFDGNFNEALEAVFKNSITLPTTGGLHLFNIRVKDEANTWGPIYKRTVYLGDNQRDMKITAGEYYWDNNSATALLVFDGNFNEALEAVYKDSISLPATGGLHVFNIRVKDEANLWGPVYKRTVYLGDLQRDIHITEAEFFWGTSDPGAGNGITILTTDGSFDEALESLFSNGIYSPGPGINLFNIRVKDEAGFWGPLYKRTVNNNLAANELQILNLSNVDSICKGDSIILEAFGGTDPQWFPATFVDNPSAVTVSAFPDTTTQFMLIAYDPYIGLDTAYYTIYVEEVPITSTLNSNDTICLGDSVVITASGAVNYLWHNASTSSNIVVAPQGDSIFIVEGFSLFGCSSLDSSLVLVNYPTTSLIIDSVCYNYTLNGQVYTDTGTYQQTLTNVAGCDSTITLVIVDNPTTSLIKDSTCYSYSLNGQSYYSSGIYQQSFINSVGCDSTLTLDIQIYDSTFNTLFVTECNYYIHNAIVYDSTGIYEQILVNSKGCDSILTFDITINSNTFDTLIESACYSYTLNSQSYNTSGIYNQTLTNVFGCDSILTLDLTINNTTYGSDILTVCNSYTTPTGVTYTASGQYSYTLANSNTCDSVVSLNLTVLYSNTGIDVQTACDSYTWIDGNTYNSSNNIATHALTNIVGCDSVVTLNLSILNSTTGSDTQTACSSYTAASGNTYTASGIYLDTISNAVACDSVVTLNLTLLNSYSQINDTICGGTYTLNGQSYSAEGTYTQTLSNTAGCDSILSLVLVVQDELNLSFIVNQQVLSNPPYNAQFTNSTANLSSHNFTWNFGDGTLLQDNNTSVNHTYQLNGLYDVSLLAEYISTGCLDTLLKVEYIYCNGNPNNISQQYEIITIFPNPTNNFINIVTSNYKGEINSELYDLFGKLILKSSDRQISLRSLERGAYMLRVNREQYIKTYKVIKQ